MEFQFRQRPLSLLIGFLLLPRHTPSKTLPRPRLRPRIAIPRKKQRRTTWVRITTTSWGMADAISSDGKTILGQTCVLTAPGSNECWYRSIVWTDGLANPTLRKRMAARTPMPQRYPPMAASSSDTANYRQAPWWRPPINAPTYTAIHCTTIDNLASEATGVSADGSVIIGNAAGSDASLQSYRYQALVEQWLDHGHAGLPGDSNSTADLISADGSVIAGSSFSGFVQHAVTWTNGSATATDLGVSGQSSGVTGISANGAVIVGWSGLFNNHDRQASPGPTARPPRPIWACSKAARNPSPPPCPPMVR